MTPAALLLLFWGALFPLPYLVLVPTRRAVKARPAHFFRAWAYFAPTLAIVLLIELTNSHFLSPWWSYASVLDGISLAMLVVFVPLYIRWWWLFTSDYLRLPNPKSVLWAMATISFLAALIASLLLDERIRFIIGGWLEALFG